MSKASKRVIEVQGAPVTVLGVGDADYLSLTEMAKRFGDESLIYNWMRNRNTLEFIGIWEQLHNPNFKGLEFDTFRSEAGLNSFSLTPRKWIEATNAIGFQSKAGRYGGGTYAHRDLAFEFGTWLSPEFKLHLIKEFQRLKEEESRRLSLTWNLHRTLSKINYRIHTDAVKTHLIPPEVLPAQAAFTYASEADLLNVALFGHTARQWRDENPSLDGNIRDHATVEQLLVAKPTRPGQAASAKTSKRSLTPFAWHHSPGPRSPNHTGPRTITPRRRKFFGQWVLTKPT